MTRDQYQIRLTPTLKIATIPTVQMNIIVIVDTIAEILTKIGVETETETETETEIEVEIKEEKQVEAEVEVVAGVEVEIEPVVGIGAEEGVDIEIGVRKEKMKGVILEEIEKRITQKKVTIIL